MGVLQEIIYIIYQIAIASWDIQLLLVLLSNRNHTGLTISTYTITISLMNRILVFPENKNTPLALYYSNKILKVLF